MILHEQAEDGNAMTDLTSPIKIVSQAVSNLVAVSCYSAYMRVHVLAPASFPFQMSLQVFVFMCHSIFFSVHFFMK